MDHHFDRQVSISGSSVIAAVSYSTTTRTLRVKFKSSGSVWEYMGVFPSDFAALIVAHSPGLVFNKRIRNRYPSRRVYYGQKTLPS